MLTLARCIAVTVLFCGVLFRVQPSWGDEKKEPLSIFEVKGVRDGVILGATGLLDLYPILNGHNFVYIRPSVNPQDLNPWDRNAIGNRNLFLDDLSDVTVALALATPVVVDYIDVGWSRAFYEDMMVFAQTLTINTAITGLFKYTVQRPLPRVYAGDPDVTTQHGGYEDFYSGHVSTTTAALSAFSVMLDYRHDSGVWPWLVTAAVGTSVAIERVQAGEHFPTAVLVGGIMGPAVGILVPYLHRREMQGAPAITMRPAMDGAEVTVTKRF